MEAPAGVDWSLQGLEDATSRLAVDEDGDEAHEFIVIDERFAETAERADATFADPAPGATLGLLEIIGSAVTRGAAVVSTGLAAAGRRVSSALARCLDTAVRAGADSRVVAAIRSTVRRSQSLVAARHQPLQGWLCERLHARRREGLRLRLYRRLWLLRRVRLGERRCAVLRARSERRAACKAKLEENSLNFIHVPWGDDGIYCPGLAKARRWLLRRVPQLADVRAAASRFWHRCLAAAVSFLARNGFPPHRPSPPAATSAPRPCPFHRRGRLCRRRSRSRRVRRRIPSPPPPPPPSVASDDDPRDDLADDLSDGSINDLSSDSSTPSLDDASDSDGDSDWGEDDEDDDLSIDERSSVSSIVSSVPPLVEASDSDTDSDSDSDAELDGIRVDQRSDEGPCAFRSCSSTRLRGGGPKGKRVLPPSGSSSSYGEQLTELLERDFPDHPSYGRPVRDLHTQLWTLAEQMETDPSEVLDRLKVPSVKDVTKSNLGADLWSSDSPFRQEIKRLVNDYNAASEEKRAEHKRQRKRAEERQRAARKTPAAAAAHATAKRAAYAKGKASAELEPLECWSTRRRL